MSVLRYDFVKQLFEFVWSENVLWLLKECEMANGKLTQSVPMSYPAEEPTKKRQMPSFMKYIDPTGDPSFWKEVTLFLAGNCTSYCLDIYCTKMFRRFSLPVKKRPQNMTIDLENHFYLVNNWIPNIYYQLPLRLWNLSVYWINKKFY